MKSFPFSILRHGGRFSYIEEMLEGFNCAFFGYKDGLNISRSLNESGYNFKKYSSPQCTIVWRKLTEEIKYFDDVWYSWGNQKYNRDNIPFDAAIQLTGISPSFYDDRDESGITLGFFNKVGRKGKHPQHGDKKQYLMKKEFMHELKSITGLRAKFYDTYNHEFYMKYFDII